jgi:N-acetylglutamate synthase
MTVSIHELERAAAAGWRAPDEATLGGWLLRAAQGFTGRANSALAVGDPGIPLPEAIEHVGGWYRARGLAAMVAVAYPVGRPRENAVDRFLNERGWLVHHGAIVMTARPRDVGGPAGGALGVYANDEPDDAWLSLYRYRGQVPPPISRLMLMSAPWQRFASVRQGGETIAIGRLAVAGNWAGLTAIEVHKGHRRRGLGRMVTAALVGMAVARGVGGIYLQVENDNHPARALYRRMGFTDHHGYHYRIAPETTDLRAAT